MNNSPFTQSKSKILVHIGLLGPEYADTQDCVNGKKYRQKVILFIC